MTPRSPYNGPSRKLVLAFDCGTTFAGISYSVLDPGLVPEIKGVTRYPGQQKVGGDAKIPSIIFYDKRGNVKAVGSEAKVLMDEWVVDDDDEEDEGWVKCEWFKLHLAPDTLRNTDLKKAMPPLPPNKTVIDIFADFMQYLNECAKSYIIQSHPSGENFWKTLNDDIEYILTHPNGWEGAQQSQMRKAAIQAGLVPDTPEGWGRVHFVTEGEASLHYCIQNGLGSHILETRNEEGIIIADIGGGTLDLSCYAPRFASGIPSFEEIAPSECALKGSVFVTRAARDFLRSRLANSRFLADLDRMMEIFDSSSKLRVRNAEEPTYIKFGTVRDRDNSVDIRSGQLRIAGKDVAQFFEPSVKAVVDAVNKQRDLAGRRVSSAFVVGGFAASEYLFSRLQEMLEPMGIIVSRPDTHVNKAVADGAVSFYLDHFVSVRVSKAIYGIRCCQDYDSSDREHRLRENDTFVGDDGRKTIRGIFDIILPQNIQVSESREFRRSYFRVSSQPSFGHVSVEIVCYLGEGIPRWTDTNEDKYKTLCIVDADTSQLNAGLKPQKSRGNHAPHYRIEYDIILSLGLTEFKAQIAWIEKGAEKRGPARMIYD